MKSDKFSIITAPSGASLIVCEDFNRHPGIVHGFTTRKGGVSKGVYESLNMGVNRGDKSENTDKNYALLSNAVGYGREKFCFTKQVHGDKIRYAEQKDLLSPAHADNAHECDALMADCPGILLVGIFADCVPILLFDPVKNVCSVVHAGWRGTALGIAAKTVVKMADMYKSCPKDIVAAIGPAIMPCCFLTHEDVVEAILKEYPEILPKNAKKAQDGRYHIDLKSINAEQLSLEGVMQIHVSRHCTCCDAELFYSHRRDGALRGSMAAVIGLKGAG